MNKAYLFVDGFNLYASQYKYFGPSVYLDFPAFIKSIEDSLDLKFTNIYFYASYFKGYRSKTSGKEKEVDVKIAVDIVDMAWKNKYANAFLLSGDPDFLHALFAAQKLKIREKLDLSNTKTKWITLDLLTKAVA